MDSKICFLCQYGPSDIERMIQQQNVSWDSFPYDFFAFSDALSSEVTKVIFGQSFWDRYGRDLY